MTMSTRAGRVTAPAWPVAAAGVAVLLALGVAVLNLTTLRPPSLALLTAGYVLGAVATVAFASVYRAARNGRRRDPRFRVQRGLDRAAAVLMLAGVAAGMFDAVLLATELAK